MAEKLQTFKPLPADLQKLALEKMETFLNNIKQRLDFELTTKTNPKDDNGTIQEGKHIVLKTYLTSGKFSKNFFADIILRKLEPGEQALSNTEEMPLEDELRKIVKADPTQLLNFAAAIIAKQPAPQFSPTFIPSEKTGGTPYGSFFGIRGKLVEIANEPELFKNFTTIQIRPEKIIQERQLDINSILNINPNNLEIYQDTSPGTRTKYGKALWRIRRLGNSGDVIIPDEMTLKFLKEG